MSDGLVGRYRSAGTALDGKRQSSPRSACPLNAPLPSHHGPCARQRALANRIKAIDALIPIGLGQRE